MVRSALFARVSNHERVAILRRVGKGALAPCPPSFPAVLLMVGTTPGAFAPVGFAHPTAQRYRTTPEINPGLRRGGLMSFFR